MPEIRPSRVAILGLGLMGGSIGKALHHLHPDMLIAAYDPNKKALAQAYADGVVQVCAESAIHATENADVVIFAMPIGQFAEVLTTVAEVLTPNMLLMDVISVKQAVVDRVVAILGDRSQQFIPTHPMAGSEQSTYAAAKGDLFEEKTIILTPIAAGENSYLQRAKSFWHEFGAIIKVLSAQEHDDIICSVSHLPHALAFTFMKTVLDEHSQKHLHDFAGSGFKDFTRIAHSAPDLWAEICLANRVYLQDQLQRFSDHTQRLQQLLQDNNLKGLADFFAWVSKNE